MVLTPPSRHLFRRRVCSSSRTFANMSIDDWTPQGRMSDTGPLPPGERETMRENLARASQPVEWKIEHMFEESDMEMLRFKADEKKWISAGYGVLIVQRHLDQTHGRFYVCLHCLAYSDIRILAPHGLQVSFLVGGFFHVSLPRSLFCYPRPEIRIFYPEIDRISAIRRLSASVESKNNP
jgi:hypothetical protein